MFYLDFFSRELLRQCIVGVMHVIVLDNSNDVLKLHWTFTRVYTLFNTGEEYDL
jgi:hypothetical protein